MDDTPPALPPAPPPTPSPSPVPPASASVKRNWLLAWVSACVVLPSLAGALAGMNNDVGALALVLLPLSLILWLVSTIMLGKHVPVALTVLMVLGGLGLIGVCFFVSCLATSGPLNFH